MSQADLSTSTQPMVTPAPIVDLSFNVLRRATEGITRLTARARHVTALANVGKADNCEETEVEDALDTAGLINEQVQTLIRSHSLYELFKKPASKLTKEEEDLKTETLQNMSRLIEIDTELSVQNANITERKDRINQLNKEWVETCVLLEKRTNEIPEENLNETEEYPEKAALVKLVGKMQTLREILIRLIPSKTSYDFMEDSEGLIEALAKLREPFTMENVLSDVMNTS